jgi:hypothetical protein
MNDIDITVNGFSTTSINHGIQIKNSTFNITNSNLFVTSINSSSINYGIKYEGTSENVIASIYKSSIVVEHNGSSNNDGTEIAIARSGIIEGNIGYHIIANNCRLNGSIKDLHPTCANEIRTFGCYRIDGSTYKVLNARGVADESSNGSIIVGDSVGPSIYGGNSQYNTLIGSSTGNAITSASFNTFIGSNVGNRVTTSNECVLVGSNAGNITGNNSVILGYTFHPITEYSGQQENVLIGKKAGYSLGNENSKNVIIGHYTAENLTATLSGQTDMENVMIGNNCATSITNGVNNVFIGDSILYDNASGNIVSGSTLVGNYSSGNSSKSGANTYLGFYTGYGNLGTENVFIGRETGRDTVEANRNVCIGRKSLYQGSQGNQNVYVGREAGYSMSYSTASFNIGIGDYTAHGVNNFADKNIMVGGSTGDYTTNATGYSITSGANNVIFGIGSGRSITTGAGNILYGEDTGKSITTGINNILIGSNAGSTLTTKIDNIFIGKNAGAINNDSDNMFIGTEAGKHNIGTRNFAFGSETGYDGNGANNMFFGHKAGGDTSGVKTSGASNLLIGYKVGYGITSGYNNVLVGSGTSTEGTARNITTGANNVCFGYLTGSALTTGSENVMLGLNSGQSIVSVNQNILIGSHTGKFLETDGNIMIGYKSGLRQTIGDKNIYVGFESNKNSRCGEYNIGIGYCTGYNNTLRSVITEEKNNLNIYIGKESGFHISSNSNILIGQRTGYRLDNIDNGYNIFMGYFAGAEVRSGDKNVYLGKNSGKFNVAGDKNVCIGNETGMNNIRFSTNKNVLIGTNAGRLNTGKKQVFIGNSLSESESTLGVGYNAQADNNIYIGNDSGISSTTGEYNIGLGERTLMNLTLGKRNIAVGNHSYEHVIGGQAVDDNGNYNIGFGEESGNSITTGSRNITIGSLSGVQTSSSIDNNILIGESAGKVSSTNNLIAIGSEAGLANTTGSDNIYIGTNAGKYNVTATNNIFFGSNAGETVTGLGGTGNNILIGSDSGALAWASLSNTIGIGANTLKSTVNATNIAIGSNASMNTGGTLNVSIGVDAHKESAFGGYNIMLGKSAGSSGSGASDCILLGTNTGKYTNASGIIGIGGNVLNLMDGDEENMIGIGLNALEKYKNQYTTNSARANNIALGTNAMKILQSSFNQTFIGTNAGEFHNNSKSEGTGTYSGELCGNTLFMGTNAGRYNYGFESCAIGKNAAQGSATGIRSITSTYISASYDSGTDRNKLFLSNESGDTFTSVGFSNNSIVAFYGFSNENNNSRFLYNIESVTSNTMIFHPTRNNNDEWPNLTKESEGNSITVFQPYELYRAVSIGTDSGTGGQLLGTNAGRQITNAFNFVNLFGHSAGRYYDTIHRSAAFGYKVGLGGWLMYDSVLYGSYAGSLLREEQEFTSYTTRTSTDYVYAIGKYTVSNYHGGVNLDISTSSQQLWFNHTVAVGNYSLAGQMYTGGTSDYPANNVCIGHYTAHMANCDKNVVLGNNAGYYMTTTSDGNNIYVGQYAGSNNPSGIDNIFLASNINAHYSNVSTTVSDRFVVYQDNELEIGPYPLMYGDISNSILAINNRSLAVDGSTTNTKLYVNGDCSANQFTSFTGAHFVDLEEENDKYEIEEGLILSSKGEVRIKNIVNTVVKVEISVVQNDKKVYGIYSGYNNDGIKVSAVGEGTMLVINMGEDIENGDYVCSSGLGGYGMKQADDILHSYTVAKVTENVVWNDVNEYVEISGVMYKKYMVGCTYHCG